MVKIVTIVDATALKSLNKFSFKKTLPLIIFLSILIILYGLVKLPDDDGSYALGITLIACGVLFLPLCLLMIFIGQKNAAKQMPLLSAAPTATFIFENDKFYIEEVKGDTYRGTTEAVYDYFNKVYETETHYFLYISQTQCHVLPKKDIVEGSAEELTTLLFRNLGPRKFVLKKGKR